MHAEAGAFAAIELLSIEIQPREKNVLFVVDDAASVGMKNGQPGIGSRPLNNKRPL
jgi:hypothetical protein